MRRYFTLKPSNWLTMPLLLAGSMFTGIVQYAACGGSAPQVKVENPSELCAQAVALSPEVRAQAAKVGLEPLELARRTCEAAVLAAKLAEANIVKPSGIAGATSSPIPPSMALAGAAGSGG
jgi:hypothetical protein